MSGELRESWVEKHTASNEQADRAEELLGIVRKLAVELNPKRRHLAIGLDSHLDRDLGFDSLSRSELMLRIEQATHTKLPETLLATAETPRDLLMATGAPITERESGSREPLITATAPQRIATAPPLAAETLTDVLLWHAEHHADRTHVELYDSAGVRTVSYGELVSRARVIAAGLHRAGLRPGGVVAIMLPTSTDYLKTFMGILVAGGIPLPIYPPTRPSQLEDHLRRHARILDNAKATLLVTESRTQAIAHLLKGHVPSLQAAVTPEAVAELADRESAVVPRHGGDIALLQYTSGSTGQPKGVVLSHAQVLSNIRAMSNAIDAQSTDTFLSWLPLYHDMGLIGAWFGSLYVGMRLVLMSPLSFLSRPSRWLTRIHTHRATISAAPNFAYEMCASRIDDEEIADLDLSSWRIAFNGAEPVRAETVRRFCERFAAHGFRRAAMAPVYGLAEIAVGLAFPPLGRGPLIDRVDREALEQRGNALPAAPDDLHPMEIVACGQPLLGYEIRVVDDAERELPERHEGRIEFRGPSATHGYMRNSEATRRLFHGEWLDSGDVGYLAGGDIFVTSRIKDVIIRAGRNVHPYELEESVGELPAVRKGCVAVFGATGPASEGQRLVVVAETRITDPAEITALERRIQVLATDVLGSAADDVLIVPPHSVLKTSSGKIRRSACRALYERGELGARARSVRWQVLRLWWSGYRLRSQRWLHKLGIWLAGWTFAIRAQVVFWLVAAATWTLVALTTDQHVCWRIARRGAQMLFRGAAISIHVTGSERLPSSPCVFVSNHASYIDGALVMAALPCEVSFVVKGELASQPVASLFLRRIGACFVERFDAQKGVEDARRIEAAVRTDRSLLYFAEGTFTRMPGLLPFHTGAFVAAVDADVPIVPLTLRGTRSVLRSDSWFPRRAVLSVEVGEPILPDGHDWEAMLRLRQKTRNWILSRCGEPDLALERVTIEAPETGSSGDCDYNGSI